MVVMPEASGAVSGCKRVLGGGGGSLMTEAPGSPGSVADNSEALLGPAKGRPQVGQPQSLRAGGGRGFQLLSELASWRACLHSHVRFTCGPRPLLGRGWDGGP